MDAPARSRRLRPEDRRAMLIDAAEAAFAVRGYQGTAMDDIAREAGVARGLIYAYFKDKDALYLACVQRAREDLEARFAEAALAQDAPAPRLEAGLRAYFTYVAEQPQRWDLLFGGGAAVAGSVAEEVSHLRFRTVERIAVLLQYSYPHWSEDAAIPYAHALSGAAEQLAKWWRTRPDVSSDDVLTRLLDTVWVGLRATGTP